MIVAFSSSWAKPLFYTRFMINGSKSYRWASGTTGSFKGDFQQWTSFIRKKISEDRYWMALSFLLTITGGYYVLSKRKERLEHPVPFISSTEKLYKDLEEAYHGSSKEDHHHHHHHGKAEIAGSGSPSIVTVSGIDDVHNLNGHLDKPKDAMSSTKVSLDNETQMMRTKYLLIGAGTASYSAMQAIKEKDPDADVIIVGSEPWLPYQRPPLSKELWFNDDASSRHALTYKNWKGQPSTVFYEQENSEHIVHDQGGVKWLLGREATSIDQQSRTVTLNDGSKIQYSKALIATGTAPKNLFLVEGKRTSSKLSTFRDIADFKKLDELSDNVNRIAIIGGGFLGSELACALAHKGKKRPIEVFQIFPEDGNMGNIFPKYLSQWTSTRLQKEGVKIISNTSIASISETNENELLVSLSNGENIHVDHAVVTVGAYPNHEMARASGLPIDHINGGILSDSKLQVSKGIFAAGDVASYFDPLFSIQRRVEHYDHAFSSGRLAGLNMVAEELNQEKTFYHHQPMFWSDLGPEVSYEAVGQIDNNLNTVGIWSSPEIVDQKSPVYNKGLVFYLKENIVVGLLMFNLLNRLETARDILTEKKPAEEIQNLVSRFKIND